MLLGVGLALLLGEPALTWEAPLHCPSEADAEAALEHYLGRRLGPEDPATSMVVREHDSGYRLELHTRAGAHVIEGFDCNRLTQLAASVAAIAIDPLGAAPSSNEPPSLVRHEPEPIVIEGVPSPAPERPRLPEPALIAPREPPPAPEWVLAPEPEPADEPEPRSRSATKLRGLLSASAGLGLAVFPRPAPGFEAALGLDRGALHVELGGGGWFAGRFRSSAGDVGGDLLAWDASVRPCGVPRWRRLELRACAVVGAGQVRGRGVGVLTPQVVRQPWVWIAGELGLAVVLHRNVALFVDAGVAANLLRPRFSTAAPDAQYVMPAISGRGRFGVEVRFP